MKELRNYDLGGCRVSLLAGGRFKLDGGAMFGIVPKALWSRGTPADEQNRIQLACNCLLVEWDGPGERRMIIESGHGDKYEEKERRIFAIERGRWLGPAVEAAGVALDSITDVVLTHLHFDHGGGLTQDVDGNRRLTFPQARVHVQRREYEDAQAKYGIMSNTYRAENLEPANAAGAWRLLGGEEEIAPGVRPLLTPGHTRGHQAVLVAGRSQSLAFTGDVLPTAAHIGPAYNMGFDLFPLENRESKRKLLAQACEQEWLLAIVHEIQMPIARVVPDGDYFALAPAEL